jgi:hypothetical protein
MNGLLLMCCHLGPNQRQKDMRLLLSLSWLKKNIITPDCTFMVLAAVCSLMLISFKNEPV